VRERVKLGSENRDSLDSAPRPIRAVGLIINPRNAAAIGFVLQLRLSFIDVNAVAKRV
jgi:hypothetical protein